MSDPVLPPRNLPEPSVQWARTLESVSVNVRSLARGAKASIEGENRSAAAITADLARRVQKLSDAADDLDEAAGDLGDAANALGEALQAVPVIIHGMGSETGVQSYGDWSTDCLTRIDVPAGKTQVDVIAIGYERLWSWSTSGGGGGGNPGPLPNSITVTDNLGGTFTLNSTMVGYADTIRRAAEANGANRDAVIIAFMTVFVESVWLMYANSNVPGSLSYPHDAVGSDNDSLGLFQQRPSSGWGSIAQLMDVTYNAQAFIGGASGPNSGNPPGLLDIPGWENMQKGVAAQAVQVSAYPERYQAWETGATQLYDALANSSASTLSWPFVPAPSPSGDMPPVGSSDEPLAEYGPRNLTGAFHEGMDFGYRNATAGAVIGSAGPGTVHLNQSGFMGYGNAIIINHGQNAGGFTVYTLYGHRQAVAGPAVGATVQTGTVLGNVGNSGASLGAHLHFEVHLVPPGGSLTWDYNSPSYESNRTAVNPRTYVGSGDIEEPGTGGGSGSFRRLQCRFVIGGVPSPAFEPSPDDDHQVFRPTWGRSISFPEGSPTLTVALQSKTDGGSTAKLSSSVSQLTAIASFT